MNPEELISENIDKVIEFRLSLIKESDRGCALMAAAYLESELGALLSKYWVDDESLRKKMLGASGPLGAFSSRIDISYLLGLIGPKVRRDLHLIRKVRNEFAHIHTPVSFDDPNIKNRCRELYHDAFGVEVQPRVKFTRTVMGVLAVLNGKFYQVQTIEAVIDVIIDDESKEINKELSTKIIKEVLGEE